MTKFIILDRDGVINYDSEAYIKSVDEWRPIPGSLEAIARLNRAGYRVVIASNQSGIGRGLFDASALQAMHRKMDALLASLGGRVDGIFYCPHAPQDACACRKPKAGLFEQIVSAHDVDLTDAVAVGDSLRDVQAALAAGAKPILVRTGQGEQTLASGQLPAGIPVFDDLAAVAAELAKDAS
jgi:D-glycero-D-manno-heptose 1,7-bisphosphate phosphatase